MSHHQREGLVSPFQLSPRHTRNDLGFIPLSPLAIRVLPPLSLTHRLSSRSKGPAHKRDAGQDYWYADINRIVVQILRRAPLAAA